VFPEGVMKATAHWLELKGHTPKSSSTIFDEEFTDQVIATGRIEDGRVIRNFFRKTGQPLKQDWLLDMARRVARRLPVKLGFIFARRSFVRARASGRGRNRRSPNTSTSSTHSSARRSISTR
jgi:heterodisulfide reductase subunit C